MFYFLGIDIAGTKNTWIVALKKEKNDLELCPLFSLSSPLSPCSINDLSILIDFSITNKVLGIGIDAPLSFSLKDKKGFRNSDMALKNLLPKKAKSWVVSYHTLMAVPIRALLVSEKLSPYCGTIIETHPRTSIYFCLPEEKKDLAFYYKQKNLKNEKDFLIFWLNSKFNLKINFDIEITEGILDAILCALASFFYHYMPEKLIFLPKGNDLMGFGPFVVISF